MGTAFAIWNFSLRMGRKFMTPIQPQIILESAAFTSRGLIPSIYTCEGSNIAPPLRWGKAPNGTKSWALIVDDPDAPDPAAPKRTFVHMVLYNIPPETTSLNEGLTPLPPGAQFGVNDNKSRAWYGPCPPKGRHRYFHKLYALDTVLDFPSAPTKAQLEEAMTGHILGQAELIGLYEIRGGLH
jgi:Raf kinase inhibitor-like YbhB/YbcL family protein